MTSIGKLDPWLLLALGVGLLLALGVGLLLLRFAYLAVRGLIRIWEDWRWRRSNRARLNTTPYGGSAVGGRDLDGARLARIEVIATEALAETRSIRSRLDAFTHEANGALRELQQSFAELERRQVGGATEPETAPSGRSQPHYAPESRRPPLAAEQRPSIAASSVRDELRRAPAMAETPSAPDLEAVAFQILDLIAPRGRLAPLATTQGLRDWLSANHPAVALDAVMVRGDSWLLAVLSSDRRHGVAIPALDSVIEPGDLDDWFASARPAASPYWAREHIDSLAHASWDERDRLWRPAAKGHVKP